VGVLLTLYAALRLPHLAILPPFDDESDYAWDALLVRSYVGARQWNGLFVSLHDGVPPLFPWLLAILLGLPLDPVVAARLLSVLAGAGTLLTLYIAGWRWTSPRAGLIAALLYIACPFALFTDRIGLLDGLLAAWALGAGVLAWQACGVDGGPGTAAAAGLCLAAAVLTKTLGALGCGLPLLAYWLHQGRGPLLLGTGHWQRPTGPDATARRRRAVEISYVVALAICGVLLFSRQFANLLYPYRLQSSVAQGGPGAHSGAALAALADYGWRYLTPPLAVGTAISLAWALLYARGTVRYLAWWVVLAGGLLVVSAGAFFPPRYLAQLVPPLLLCTAAAADALLKRLPLWGGPMLAMIGLSALIWSVPFDRALLENPVAAPLPAVDHAQYITGWPAGFGLPQALALVRRLGGTAPTLYVLGVTNPPFTQAQVALRDRTSARVVGVRPDRPISCAGPATFALLDTPRDDETAFRRVNGAWRRVVAFQRPEQGGAYVLYRCRAA